VLEDLGAYPYSLGMDAMTDMIADVLARFDGSIVGIVYSLDMFKIKSTLFTLRCLARRKPEIRSIAGPYRAFA